MATKRVCDRCGAEINPTSSATYVNVRSAFHEKSPDIELCCSCAMQIKEWLKPRVEAGKRMAEMKPCPFCGGEVSLVLCDDEGNLHDEAYREHPYSGLGFMLHHAHEDNPECPIASYECDGGILGGVYIYDTEEQAVEAWNRRVNDD